MITHAKRLTKSQFARNVAIVASGTAGAQAITMAFSPIITRLYGPEAFGVLGTFTAILAVLAPLAALSYPIAIVLPKRDADALGLAKLSLGIAMTMSLLAALILTLFKAPIVNAFNLEAVESYILLLPLAMFFSASMAVMSQWVIRKNFFKIKAKVAVLQALWLNTTKVCIGLFTPVAAVLVALATFGSALHAFMLWAGVRKFSQAQPAMACASSSRELAWQHRDFAYYRTPQVVINAASESMPVLMLAGLFGSAAAGFYALARMALGVPSQLIGRSVADVFYPKFVETQHLKENTKKLLIKACLSLLVAGFFPYFLILMLGPEIFSFIFGTNWRLSGELSQWMALWLFVVLVSRPVISAIPALGLQKQFLLFEIAAVGSRILSLYLGFVLTSSAVATIALLSLTNFMIYILLVIYIIHKA